MRPLGDSAAGCFDEVEAGAIRDTLLCYDVFTGRFEVRGAPDPAALDLVPPQMLKRGQFASRIARSGDDRNPELGRQLSAPALVYDF